MHGHDSLATNKIAIVEAGALPPLVSCLTSSNVGVQEQAAACLRGLSSNCMIWREIVILIILADNQSRIVEEGALGCLLELLRSDSKDVQEHACGALRNLSMKRCRIEMSMTLPADISRKVVEEGGLSNIVPLMRSSEERIQEQAITLVRNLSVVGGIFLFLR